MIVRTIEEYLAQVAVDPNETDLMQQLARECLALAPQARIAFQKAEPDAANLTPQKQEARFNSYFALAFEHPTTRKFFQLKRGMWSFKNRYQERND
jgi:hypothetical protein